MTSEDFQREFERLDLPFTQKTLDDVLAMCDKDLDGKYKKNFEETETGQVQAGRCTVCGLRSPHTSAKFTVVSPAGLVPTLRRPHWL